MIREFVVVDGWMRFQTLDALEAGTPAHVLAWRFKDDTDEAWTKRLNAFKNQERAALAGAVRVLVGAIPPLMARNGWLVAETAMTAALSSNDTQSIPAKPLPRVGRAVAASLGLRWLPDILTKDAHRKLHTIGPAADRDAELAKANYKCVQVTGAQRILVFDDLITRGATFTSISQAIKEQNRSLKVYPIALGKPETKSYASSLGKELTNEHVPARWATLWDTG